MIKDKLADRLDLIIPGGHVKALTSASRLIKEYEFSHRQHYIETLLSQGDDSLVRPKPQAEKGAGAEGGKPAAGKDPAQAELAKLDASDLDGTILVRAEWHGFGEQMPPARSETLFEANTEDRSRVGYSR